jgi:hypothetical protein
MSAEITFRSSVTVWIYVESVVRAGLHARFAANTAVSVKIDNAVRSAEQGNSRTDLNAGRIVAMVAAQDSKVAGRVRKRSLFDVLDPGTIDSDGNTMFCFACHRAGVATNAAMLVNDESEAHDPLFLAKLIKEVEFKQCRAHGRTVPGHLLHLRAGQRRV